MDWEQGDGRKPELGVGQKREGVFSIPVSPGIPLSPQKVRRSMPIRMEVARNATLLSSPAPLRFSHPEGLQRTPFHVPEISLSQAGTFRNGRNLQRRTTEVLEL